MTCPESHDWLIASSPAPRLGRRRTSTLHDRPPTSAPRLRLSEKPLGCLTSCASPADLTSELKFFLHEQSEPGAGRGEHSPLGRRFLTGCSQHRPHPTNKIRTSGSRWQDSFRLLKRPHYAITVSDPSSCLVHLSPLQVIHVSLKVLGSFFIWKMRRD